MAIRRLTREVEVRRLRQRLLFRVQRPSRTRRRACTRRRDCPRRSRTGRVPGSGVRCSCGSPVDRRSTRSSSRGDCAPSRSRARAGAPARSATLASSISAVWKYDSPSSKTYSLLVGSSSMRRCSSTLSSGALSDARASSAETAEPFGVREAPSWVPRPLDLLVRRLHPHLEDPHLPQRQAREREVGVDLEGALHVAFGTQVQAHPRVMGPPEQLHRVEMMREHGSRGPVLGSPGRRPGGVALAKPGDGKPGDVVDALVEQARSRPCTA